MLSRMAAYRDFIRREGDESWQKLSDNELEDMIANAMRGFASDIAGARALVKMTFWVAGAAVVCGLLFFLDDLQGVARGMSMPIFFALWFAAVLGTGFVAALVVSYWREKSIEKKWSRGWDVNKLIV
jgi:hypothetical protein